MTKMYYLMQSGFLKISILSFMFILIMAVGSSGHNAETTTEAHNNKQIQSEQENITITVAEGRIFISMTKKEAYEVKGVPYRVKRLPDEENMEMWIYRCFNDEGFNEDCLYLYFNEDELEKIERP